MEEEIMLKQKYNDLLQSYNTGKKYVEENPTDEKAEKKLNSISKEMEKVLSAIDDKTQEDITNGFEISENVEKEDENVSKNVKEENTPKKKTVKKQIESKEMIVTKKENLQNSYIIQTTTGEIDLSPEIVKKNLVNGNGNVTDQEVMYFRALCQANRLNPYIKEAYLIKYGSQPAQMIVSKDVFFKRAIEHPCYNGFESGIVVEKENGDIINRQGHIYGSKDRILGAWCRVYRKDWEHPVYQEVNFKEYVGRKSTGEINSQWATKPATMITKVAEATALRKAFTDSLQGMYIEEENYEVQEEREKPKDIL